MTTIAYRDGIIAADGCTSNDEITHKRGTVDKVYKLKTDKPNKFIYWASAGDEGLDAIIEEHMLAELDQSSPVLSFPEKADFEILAVFPNGKVGYMHSKNMAWEYWKADYWVAGSGGDLALGAMAAGADAVLAVFAACKHSFGSSEPIQGYDTRTGNDIRYATEEAYWQRHNTNQTSVRPNDSQRPLFSGRTQEFRDSSSQGVFQSPTLYAPGSGSPFP